MAVIEAKGPAEFSSLKLGLDSLVGFVGFACAVACVLGLYIAIPQWMTGGADRACLRVVNAVAMAVAFSLIGLASHSIARSRYRALTVAAAVGLVSLIAAFYVPGLPFWAVFVCCAVASAGLSALIVLWFGSICMQPHRAIQLFVSAGICVGTICCLVGFYLVADAAYVFLASLWALSFGCSIVLGRLKSDMALPPAIGNRESDKRSKILKTSTIMLSFSSFEFGFVVSIGSDGQAVAFCLGSAAIVTGALAIDSVRHRIIGERSMSPLTPPLTVFGFASVYLFGDAIQVVGLCVLAGLFALYTAFAWAAMAEHTRVSRLSAARTFSKARMLDYAVLAIGLASGFAIAQVSHADVMLATRITIGIAVGYGFLAAYCHKARFPEVGVEDEGLLPMPETKGLWKKRCRAAAEQHDLSERQYEVLVLVAQGRSAKYIEQALTISLSTVQTHIRNIYHKTGVHSRQELLSLIENTKLYGED